MRNEPNDHWCLSTRSLGWFARCCVHGIGEVSKYSIEIPTPVFTGYPVKENTLQSEGCLKEIGLARTFLLLQLTKETYPERI
ncbi:hypothetical protein SCG7086_AA_00080 [Chlamydiales bacterium SCGC AG-110-P3]|nr:hypothetical protein SCG7086_AA_00080 [Chlamydiales bacterium SCGC AG-110-P3]